MIQTAVHDFGVALISLIFPIVLIEVLEPGVLGVTFFDSPGTSVLAAGIAGFVALVGAAAAGVYRNFSIASLKIQAEQIKLVTATETLRADRAEDQVTELHLKLLDLTTKLGTTTGELNLLKFKYETEIQCRANSKT